MEEEKKRSNMLTPEGFNAWRIFPRLAFGLMLFIMIKVTDWYLVLEEPTAEQTGALIGIYTAVCAYFKFYVDKKQ